MALNRSVWDKDIPVPANAISFVDAAVIKMLPRGTSITSISPSGTSYWARTARIKTLNADSQHQNYFLKVHQGSHGRKMVSSEFHSMAALYKVMPSLVARPTGHGTYESIPDTHFFICAFHSLSGSIPDVKTFPALLAEMHKRGVSPDGKFGFPMETFAGNSSQILPVSDTWEECFSKGLQHVFENEVATHGRGDEEFEELKTQVMDKVIPRLLRPLETGGRSMTPCLVHGDLWDGNASVDVDTGRPIIFDGTPLYAHNEYELGPWRATRHRMTNAYIDEYVKHFPISEPSKEFDDRGELYCLRFDLMSSSLYDGNIRYRAIGRETMRKLVGKYGGN